MANLEQITSKIKKDSETQKEAILKDAKLECEKIIEKKISSAKKLAEEILKKSETESIDRKSRILSSAELKVRNEKLEAKQAVIENTFKLAKEKLNSMNEKEFKAFVKMKILSLNIVGDENIILNKNNVNLIDEAFIAEINKELELKGKKGQLKISKSLQDFNGGFILEKNGIEVNITFDSLVDSLRDDMEFEIARILFN
ncbi:MAG: V-type ATP synthase subunit E [Sarcina sp.]